MKFGKQLRENARVDWKEKYIDYSTLKRLIKRIVDQEGADDPLPISPRTTSLSMQRALDDDDPHEKFFTLLNREVEKVGNFTRSKVDELKKQLQDLGARVNKRDYEERSREQEERINLDATYIGSEFLSLEKYVNLNYMGFHKILKKHDKKVPRRPCQIFYLSHLHTQEWVQANYSDVLLSLSKIYATLRKDCNRVLAEGSAQDFTPSTYEYYVKGEHISTVKNRILQNLPVFQFNAGESFGDAQLINSIYLDNSSLESYHSQLDKRPYATTIRLRWYGANTRPSVVFVERMTHREGLKGEENFKERFALPEDKVLHFLKNRSEEETCLDLPAQSGCQEETRDFGTTFQEIKQQIDSKQLKPLIRTQYMRTVFQLPFDVAVRVSLDTNVVMIKENSDGGPSASMRDRWCRDPSLPVKQTDITRFPYAVLKVKLSKHFDKPQWLQELMEDGYLNEFDTFSKFIHGTAALFPDMARAWPFWVDCDETIRSSMHLSAPPARDENSQLEAATSQIRSNLNEKQCSDNGMLRRKLPKYCMQRNDDELLHPLLGDEQSLNLLGDRDEKGFRNHGQNPGKPTLFARLFGVAWRKPPANSLQMRIEPKTYFANERTFFSWLSMAVTVGSIATALLGFSGTATRDPNKSVEIDLMAIIAMILLPVAIILCIYAVFIFVWRGRLISENQVHYFDDKIGPLGLTMVVVTALSIIFCIGTYDFVQDLMVG